MVVREKPAYWSQLPSTHFRVAGVAAGLQTGFRLSAVNMGGSGFDSERGNTLMTFQVPEADIADYFRSGFIVFRSILPPSLIADLRRECDKAVAIVRAASGPQVQRIQPLSKYDGQLNLQPFRDYAEVPALREALNQVLSPRHHYGMLDIMGVLFEPADRAWCMPWHRDMTLESSRLSPQEFQDLMLDWNAANQINCPLYDDDCTWFVPGSHLRARDLPGESTVAKHPLDPRAEKDAVRHEQICWDYARSMPGAIQLHLHPGDFAMYRPIGWHTGNYVPYKKRATLHDGVFTPESEAWWRAWIKGGSPKWTRGVNT